MSFSLPTLVFDFDGTLTDVLSQIDLFFTTLNALAEKHHFRKIEKDEIELLRGLSTKELLKNLHIPLLKLPIVLAEIRQVFHENSDLIRPAPDVFPVLKNLGEDGYMLGILTSNVQENVENFLEKYDCKIFDFIYSGSSTFGKARVMKKMVKDQKLDPKKVLYFGDETRDVDAAKSVGFTALAVSWGLNNAFALQKAEPAAVLNSAADLQRFVQNFSSS